MTKKILLCMFAFGAQFAQARVINVADHGIIRGKDVTFELNRLIQSVQNEPDVTLVFREERYDFYPENALEEYRAVSNHDNSLKRMAFPLFNNKNITIDGNGALFMFHGRMNPFALDGVHGATLKNFSIDWARPFHNELLVVERNEKDKSFIIEIDREKYPYTLEYDKIWFERDTWRDPFGSNIIFDPKTRAPYYDTKKYSVQYSKPVRATTAGKNRVKIEAGVKEPPPAGSVLMSYGVNPTSRLCPAIHVANSSNIYVENVTVYAAGGMALIVERTENIHLNHFVVTSTRDRMVCTRADATHFIGCKGTIRLENCLFEHMLDDGINVHGAYVKVEKYLGQKEFICAISHPQQWGLTFAGPGDKVALLSRETLLPFFNTTVEKVKAINEQKILIVLSEVPASLPKGPLSMENLTWYPDVVMKHNIIRENRARSALITTKGNVLIEDNYFSSQMNGILIEGDNNKWYESGAVQDVTITNNVFENIGFGGGPVYPLYASPLLTPEQRLGEGQYHRNINFANNTVKSFNGHMVFARSVKGLNIAGNTLEFSTDYPASSDFASVDLHYCDEVTVKDNRIKGFKHSPKITRSSGTTNVEIDPDDGFDVK